MNLTYTEREDGLLYPNLSLPEEPESLGAFAIKRKEYLRRHKSGMFSHLIMTGRLGSHLAETEQAATERLTLIMEQMAREQNVTEQLKAENQMEWVRRMNSIRQSAMETVLSEIVYN